jgi:hypothetical protein
MSDPSGIGSRSLLVAIGVSALLYVIAVVAHGTPPGAAASGADVVSWLRAHPTASDGRRGRRP